MSVAEKISNRVKFMRKGRPFLRSLFALEGNRAAVDKALSLLVNTGVLERVARGVYMRPKQVEFVGAIRPSPVTIMKMIAKAKGEKIEAHGCEAVRRFGLSTQMQVLPTYYTSGASREIRVGKARVRLLHVSAERLKHAGTRVGMALNAFHYLGKEGLTLEVVTTIFDALSKEELTKLRACKMPKWMMAVMAAADERMDQPN
jgi:hypothetical protein